MRIKNLAMGMFVLASLLLFCGRNALGQELVVGAAHTDSYFWVSEVGVVANQSSMIGSTHLVDSLVSSGVRVRKIFCPEHGFRGQAEAGATVKNDVDSKTGLPIISLYGKNKKPTKEQMEGLRFMIFDIQDVGARFYTYISTLHYVMEACAENDVTLIVLDRPNPNGYYVDGPVLEKKFQSFVGMHEVPVVHGMTIGEYAKMINGEFWLRDSLQCGLFVVRMDNYDHNTRYHLPIAPSPNLQTDKAIELYPSLCFFEGTNVSVGRGTDFPFEIIGCPSYKPTASEMGRKIISFTPRSIKGVSENPPFKGVCCKGLDLSECESLGKLDISYLIEMYNGSKKSDFFLKNGFFDRLAGTSLLRAQIQSGMSEKEIRQSWEPRLSEFKEVRKQYLLYSDFCESCYIP